MSRFSVRPAVYEMYKRVGAGIFLGDTLTGSETGHFSFGPTFVLPVSHHTALIPSVGLEYRESDRKSWQRGVNAGLFFGLFDVGPTLTPFSFGPRVDLFYGTTHAKDRTVVFSIQGDTPLILVEILILIWKGLR